MEQAAEYKTENIAEYRTYEEFKNRLDNNVKRQAADFIECGYMLKVARDTDILEKSRYETVAEFAKEEYGWDKDVVSRYIAINDRFSENGYSDKISEKYEDFGKTKLQEMLNLPQSIIDEITPQLSKRQIQDIRREVQEEKKITDIEVLCEQDEERAVNCETTFEKIIYEIIKNYKEDYSEIIKAAEDYNWSKTYDLLAPAGTAVITTRVLGEGRYITILKEKNASVNITNVRTGIKVSYTEGAVMNTIANLFREISYEAAYPDKAEKSAGEKTKVAPAQPETEVTDTEENNTETKENEKELQSEENKPKNTETEEFYPDPVQMTSICYTCLHNSQCGRKTTTCTECSEYINKAEAEKTEEQKYSEEQDKTDKETAKILQSRADEDKMKTLPGEADLRKIHEIKIAHEYYDDVAAGIKTFELRKNDRDYKVNDSLKMTEYKAGKPTGREINATITYMLEDYTGLEEGYCILGIEAEGAK